MNIEQRLQEALESEGIDVSEDTNSINSDFHKKKEIIKMEDFQEDLVAIFGNEELSEEFKQRVATVFEAAVNKRVEEIIDALQEEYTEYVETTLAEEVESIKEEFADKIDDYVSYTATQFIEENRLALEHSAKYQILESVVDGIKGVFASNYVELDEEETDLVESLVSEAEELESKANQLLDENIQLTKMVASLKKESIVKTLGESLIDTDYAKFVELTDSLSFNDEEEFATKCEHILESYFTDSKKPQVKVAEQTTTALTESVNKKQPVDRMSVYLNALNTGVGNR